MSDEQNLKLFVGGLHLRTDTDSLKKYFSKFGEVTDAVVMTDRATQKSKGFGFVTFKTVDGVDEAQRNRPHTIDNKQVDTKRAIPKDDPSPESRFPSMKIFVGGIKDVTKDELTDYFSQFGNVSDAQLVLDKVTRQSRGFAFVTFDDTDSVDKVILQKDHYIGNRAKANVKKALAKTELETINMKKQQRSYGNAGAGSYNGAAQGWGGQGYYDPNAGWGADYSAAGYGAAPVAQGGYGQTQWGAQPGWGAYGQPMPGAYGAQGGYGDGGYGAAPAGPMRVPHGQPRAAPYGK
jgi:heterogeneous nuclear ribonucleoprotein A1/A3